MTHFTEEKENYPTPAQNGENGELLNIPGNLPGKLQLSCNWDYTLNLPGVFQLPDDSQPKSANDRR